MMFVPAGNVDTWFKGLFSLGSAAGEALGKEIECQM